MDKTTFLEGFKCTGCGECCRWSGSVLLDNEDVSRIAKRVGLPEQEFIAQQTRLAPNRIQLALIDNPDGSCRFLKENRCSIYSDRPSQCRNFPHTWTVKEGCPALDALRAAQNSIDQAQGNL